MTAKEVLAQLIERQVDKRESLWPDEDGRHYTADIRNLDKIGEIDAARFMRSVDLELVRPRDDGDFDIVATSRTLRVFNHIGSSSGRQVLSAWVEPIITIALISWLHEDMGWPPHLLVTETVNNRFDLSCRSPSSSGWLIHGEAKTNSGEAERMATFLAAEINGETPARPSSPARALNWMKKAVAFSSEPAPVLLAFGPNDRRSVFRHDGQRLTRGDDRDLRFA